MVVTVQHFDPKKISSDCVAMFMTSDKQSFADQSKKIVRIWRAAGSLFDSKDFKGEKLSSALVYGTNAKMPRLILIGLGAEKSVDAETLRRAAGMAAQKAVAAKGGRLSFVLPEIGLDDEMVVSSLVEGGLLANYSYDKFITTNPDKKTLKKLSILTKHKDDVREVRTYVRNAEAMAGGTLLARDLANGPSNEIYPDAMAEKAKELSEFGVKVTVYDKKQIEEIGMGGLLAVNQGSATPPRFIIMEWNGGGDDDAPIVLVGKGVTFDTGGISLKPGAGMGNMKMDMGGAAAVIGAMYGVANMKLPTNVVGLVPTTDNMPSGSAYKPGDVITFLNGKTAEIDNTDAEGRLILADALTYADRYKPKAVVDLATLTGACMIALGHHAAALMGNDDELKSMIKRSGERTYERVVEFPLFDEYKDQMKSDVADMRNTGGRPAGSITAGLFLQNFIGDYKWAHVDIAGAAMVPQGNSYVNKGGTGFGARLMIDMVRSWNDSGEE